MRKDTERIERYLSGIEAPRCECDPHRRELRRRILGEFGGRQTMYDRMRSWRYVTVIALIGTGVVAGAAGVALRKYHFIEKRDGRGYLVQSEDGQSTMVISEGHASTPEQAVEHAQELALLKQRGQRALVGVAEAAVNGQHDMRLLSYRYTLPNGRITYMGERDPNDDGPFTLADGGLETALREIETRGVAAAPYEQVVQGRPFAFDVRKVVLDDGTEILRAYGRPKETAGMMQQGDEITWTLEHSLDMPGLNPPVVQWAIFDEDPLLQFTRRIEARREELASRLNAAGNPQRRDMVRSTQISAVWDGAFREITADNLQLLTAAHRGTFSFTANTPPGRKWFVTKIVTIDKKAFCWCVPIEARTGKSIPVILNKKNIVDLTQVYDKVMSSKAPTK
ncbi:MAG: hypothetical protein ABFE13_22505 [Phycisphaerales bacterium]